MVESVNGGDDDSLRGIIFLVEKGSVIGSFLMYSGTVSPALFNIYAILEFPSP